MKIEYIVMMLMMMYNDDDDDNHTIWPLIIYFGGHTVTLYPIAFALPRKSYGIGLLFTPKLRTVVAARFL